MRFDRDLPYSKALVVDSNPTSRSILSTQLREYGVGSVTQCGRIHDARRTLETRSFDVVLCEHRFDAEDAGYTAQHLLDDLRRNQLLPFATVFIIITAEASYAMVADAAESALDSYLIKPHTATSLGERLTQARRRKRTLANIFLAIEQLDHETAIKLCRARFESQGDYWLYAARIGSELMLRHSRHDDAKQLYEAALAHGNLPWARLGVARAQIEAKQHSQAQDTLQLLMGDHPTFADAYDVMGRVQVEQGRLNDALETFRKASALTPGSINRLQKQGTLAFYLGDREEAAKALERAAGLGISSKMFDHQSLMLLAFSRFQQRDGKALQRCLENLQHAFERAPGSHRLQRFVSVTKVFNFIQLRQMDAAAAEVRELFGKLQEPNLDIEAACNLLALLAQLASENTPLDSNAGDWVDTLALRFASSKGTAELLLCASSLHEPFAERIRRGQARIGELAEQAISHAVRGHHRAAVQALIAQAELTLNGKLIEMARNTLQRHEAKIDGAADLSATIESLRSRYANNGVGSMMAMATGRQPGALSLREPKVVDADPIDGAKTEGETPQADEASREIATAPPQANAA